MARRHPAPAPMTRRRLIACLCLGTALLHFPAATAQTPTVGKPIAANKIEPD